MYFKDNVDVMSWLPKNNTVVASGVSQTLILDAASAGRMGIGIELPVPATPTTKALLEKTLAAGSGGGSGQKKKRASVAGGGLSGSLRGGSGKSRSSSSRAAARPAVTFG